MYADADRAGADPGLQFPSSAMEPTSLMVCPQVVVTFSLKVTATLETGVQLDVVVEAGEDVVEETGEDTVLVGVETAEETAVVRVEIEEDTVLLGLPPGPAMAMSAQLR